MVSDLTRWPPGSTVRVAFLDGESGLHERVALATHQITDACNLKLDFGRDETTREYRRWREGDTSYAAEIRVSFDCNGYWSLVGTDSTDRTVGAPKGQAGGRPGQRSLNLGGFCDDLRDGWEGVVRHEFLHALGFRHSHQNMRGPCEKEFRWEDDLGYTPTQDAHGVFVADQTGRRPGIYTYLAGAPNWWPRQMVDENLRTVERSDTIAGPFDSSSIMLYSFEPLFYRSIPSRCAPTGNGLDLSAGDRRGLALLYPSAAGEVGELTARASRVLVRIGAGAEGGFKADGADSAYAARVSELLRALTNDGRLWRAHHGEWD